MFDEIFAEAVSMGDDCTGSVAKKDGRGIVTTIKPTVAPCGDLLDDSDWLSAVKDGASVKQTVKQANGVKRTRGIKEMNGKSATKAVAKLFGITVKPKKPAKVEGTESEDDTALEGATASK